MNAKQRAELLETATAFHAYSEQIKKFLRTGNDDDLPDELSIDETLSRYGDVREELAGEP